MKVIDTCPWLDGYPILEVEFPSAVSPVTAECTIWDLNAPGAALGTVSATVGLSNGAVLDTQGAAVTALVDLRVVRAEHYRFDFRALDGGGLPIGEIEPVLVNTNSASAEETMYGGAVWLQTFNNSLGAPMGFALTTPGVFEFGFGSRSRPVNNWSDLFTVMAALGYRQIKFGGSAQCPTPSPVTALEGKELYAWGDGTLTPNGVTLNLGRSDVQVALNNWNGGGFAGSCKVKDSTNATWFGGSPEYVDGFIEGTQTLGAGSWDMTYNRCSFRGAVLDWGLTNRGSLNTYSIIDARGSFTVEGVVAGGVVEISGLNMSVTIGTTVDPTADITVVGTGSITDNRNPLAPGYVAVTHVPGTATAADVDTARAAIQGDTAAILADTAALDGRVPASPAAVGDVTAAQAAIQVDIAAQNDLSAVEAQAAAAAAIAAAALATASGLTATQAAVQADIAAQNDLSQAEVQAAAAAAIAAATLATSGDVTAAQAAIQADIAAQNDLSQADVQAALRSVLYTYTFTVAGGATSTVIPTDATQADAFFDDYFVLVTDGAQSAIQAVQGYLNASGEFTLDSALPFIPTPGATLRLVGVALRSAGAAGAATPADVLASQVVVQADIATRAAPADIAAAQATIQADITGVPTSVRDVALAGSAAGSLGESLLVLFALAGKSNVRLDNFNYVVTPASAQLPNGGRFLSSVRIRVFADATAAGNSTPNAVGSEGAIYTVTLTGLQHSTYLDLPASVLGILS